MKMLNWRSRKGWKRLFGVKSWDTGLVDLLGNHVRICTRCGCSFTQRKCPSFICSPENILPVFRNDPRRSLEEDNKPCPTCGQTLDTYADGHTPDCCDPSAITP